MLVLSRKENQGIRIADNMEVVVLEIKNGSVRLGFKCSDDTTILRTEVWERQQAKTATAGPTATEHCGAG